MYSYTWDEETGGLLLNSSPLQFSKEPRPVFSEELDILGFGKMTTLLQLCGQRQIIIFTEEDL